MANVFLSYSTKDRDVARRVANDLRQFGNSVWFDQDLVPGDDWVQLISDAIQRADVVVVLLSRASLLSPAVTEEWEAALAQHNKRVIPALIKGADFSDLPPLLRNVQGVNLGDRYDAGVRSLTDAIARASVSMAPPVAESIDIEKLTHIIKHQVLEELKLAGGIAPHLKAAEPIDDKLVFVITSFRPDMEPIFEAIAGAASSHGLRAERVKDVVGDHRITETMLSMLRRARLVVADLTHERPNVYFELGYARALGKKVITILRDGTERHFDVYDWNYIAYTDSRPLERTLAERFNQELSLGD